MVEFKECTEYILTKVEDLGLPIPSIRVAVSMPVYDDGVEYPEPQVIYSWRLPDRNIYMYITNSSVLIRGLLFRLIYKREKLTKAMDCIISQLQKHFHKEKLL